MRIQTLRETYRVEMSGIEVTEGNKKKKGQSYKRYSYVMKVLAKNF